jgi:predicted component of type VI protein secretion system
MGESARIYDDVRGNGGKRGLSAVVTGIFTVAGVVVTAATALLATWMRYKTDRRQELRKERRQLYARFQHASAQLWDALFQVISAGKDAAAPSDDAVRAVNESWIMWAKTWAAASCLSRPL